MIRDEFQYERSQTELIYLVLPDVQTAMARVKDRVEKGGHVTSIQEIEHRFTRGLQILDSTFSLYDSTSIFLSAFKSFQPLALFRRAEHFAKSYHEFPQLGREFLMHIFLAEYIGRLIPFMFGDERFLTWP